MSRETSAKYKFKIFKLKIINYVINCRVPNEGNKKDMKYEDEKKTFFNKEFGRVYFDPLVRP